MLSWLILILVIAAIAIFGAWVTASFVGRGEAIPPLDEPHDVIAANRTAVDEGRYNDIALEVVPRGYRQDQVDALLEHLLGKQKRNIGEEFPPTATAPAGGKEITEEPRSNTTWQQ
ncbi:cell division protein DivIVA [uncultured Corynebacterium sp.]|uniref:cell division protein DivIVA n=1 Tax=uncultured Corynebacterium sp. TaxID=159447 RepID=UPI002607CD3B|nr:cell division protein DivIVA [uncultured Corynebacterium sp.]